MSCMQGASPHPLDPFRDMPRSDAQRTLDESRDELLEALEELGKKGAMGPLRGAQWSLDGAPDVGFTLADFAAENMEGGRHMLAPTLVEDALRNLQLSDACFRQGRFARESIIRYLHASGDVLSQVVNAALDLGIREQRCSLHTVARDERVRAHESLCQALDDFEGSETYKYVADAANRMKHRTFLPGGIEAFVSEDGTAVTVNQATWAFEHNQVERPKTSLDDLHRQVDELRLAGARVLGEIAQVLRAGGSGPPACAP